MITELRSMTHSEGVVSILIAEYRHINGEVIKTNSCDDDIGIQPILSTSPFSKNIQSDLSRTPDI